MTSHAHRTTDGRGRLYDSVVDTIGNTPCIRLNRIAPPHVRVYVKAEYFNPASSVKDRLAISIIEEGERRGELKPGQTVVEATSGNTGIGLAMVCAAKGYPLVVTMADSFSIERRRLMRFLGAKVVLTPRAAKGLGMYQKAQELADANGWFLARQFETADNASIHENTTGRELVADFEGERLDYWVTGYGTGGTLTGVARCFERSSPRTRMVLADPAGSVLAEMVRSGRPGVDGAYQVEGIGSSRVPPNLELARVHRAEVVIDDESFAMTRRLWSEEGLLVGGSSGTAVVAALRVARESNPGDGAVVVLLPDSWDRYRSKEWAQPAGPD